jgi:AbrB family looped-hinge helix DNA binding protein
MGTTLTVKGQVTIPKAIRDYLGLVPGSEVEFDFGPDGRVVLRPLRPARPLKAKRFAKLRGTGKRVGLATADYMRLIRGYDEDAADPGFR